MTTETVADFEDGMLWEAESYRRHDNVMMADFLVSEVAARQRERQRAAARCRRCTWGWYPVGSYPWRCVRCPAVAVAL